MQTASSMMRIFVLYYATSVMSKVKVIRLDGHTMWLLVICWSTKLACTGTCLSSCVIPCLGLPFCSFLGDFMFHKVSWHMLLNFDDFLLYKLGFAVIYHFMLNKVGWHMFLIFGDFMLNKVGWHTFPIMEVAYAFNLWWFHAQQNGLVHVSLVW